MVTTVLAPDHPNPTQYPTPPITSNRVQPLLVRRRLLLRALPVVFDSKSGTGSPSQYWHAEQSQLYVLSR